MSGPSLLKKSTTWVLLAWVSWLVYSAISASDDSPAPPPEAAKTAPEYRPTGYAPEISEASDEAARQIATFRLREGFTARLVAAEPLIANPVAFWMDWKGRCYVAETFRQETTGVPDNRGHTYWIPDDLAATTVADRAAMYLKHHPDYATKWTREQDRVRRLVDDDGDGVADRSEVFADGFDDLLDGTGAGVLSVGRDVFYTCIPHLWRLRDEDGDGFAETRDRLHSGYGVRVALRGHDMHGLIRGPDGKLWFSIGDRGYDVTTAEGKHLADPRSGAVFRCNLDGSGLEVYATGLRNPQELAFDDYGNLFTGDNNGDGGDKARIVYVAEGGETGWRMNYQYIPERGPWVNERWYEPEFDGRVAAYLPPIANLGSGPSGLTCYPGTGLPDDYAGWFFLCDFLGASSSSGIRAFKLEPRGAGFALVDDHWFVKGLLATDCDFGADGVLYATDWVQGWVGEGKGRLYAFEHEAARDREVRRTRRLLAGGIARLPFYRQLKLLGHRDRRVRLEAQFACAARGPDAVAPLHRILRDTDSLDFFPRLHALWALGQMVGRHPEIAEMLVAGLADGEPEIRAQAAKLVGDHRIAAAAPALRRALAEDVQERVRYFAAISLGKLADREALPIAIEALRDNGDRDVFLRHALVMALVGPGDPAALAPWAKDESCAVRRGVLLAWRRLGSERVATFLDDDDRSLVIEAARAIYDRPVPAAYATLAAKVGELSGDSSFLEGFALAKRILGSCDLLSRPEDARALARVAAADDLPAELRRFALRALERWDPAPKTEPLLNDLRPRPTRRREDAVEALAPHLEAFLENAPPAVREIAARLSGSFGRRDLVERLVALVSDDEAGTGVRVAALDAVVKLEAGVIWSSGTPRWVDVAIERALASGVSRLRGQAGAALAKQDPERAIPLLATALRRGGEAERQLAAKSLGEMAHPVADGLLARRLEALLAAPTPTAELLELRAACRTRAAAGAATLMPLVARFESEAGPVATPLTDLAPLAGGDPVRGRRLFRSSRLSCVRCHSLDDKRSELAGPPLGDVGRRLEPALLAQSILAPNAVIAPGYATALIETRDGELYDGRVLEENDEHVVVEVLDSGEPERVEIPGEDVAFRKRSASAMPTDLGEKLSPAELRDLVAFLASLEGKPADTGTPRSGH